MIELKHLGKEVWTIYENRAVNLRVAKLIYSSDKLEYGNNTVMLELEEPTPQSKPSLIKKDMTNVYATKMELLDSL